MMIFQKFLNLLSRCKVPEHLRINSRKKLNNSEFKDEDKLYRSYNKDQTDEKGDIRIEIIRFPDMSCNWDRFSVPIDIVEHRENGNKNDGCYSFTVLVSRFENIATPVHDPKEDQKYPNYSHVEVRILKAGQTILDEPQKGNKLRSNSKKMNYRINIQNNLYYEIRI
ncbi:MAG: hypothetical protein KAS64_07580 [Spirochaetes bacterium]|nr:hypothetical protein [Spirochaetota bacterium]